MPRDNKRYNYQFSELLNMDIAIAKDGSHIITNDGVRYSKSEIEILKTSGKINQKIHMVKKIFNPSEIIGYSKIQAKSALAPRMR